uniref:Uncharacterized protein n=1 Tax=Anguilla anguilla TaxID=7936 RepID=A0A0E9PUW0_ANGAN
MIVHPLNHLKEEKNYIRFIKQPQWMESIRNCNTTVRRVDPCIFKLLSTHISVENALFVMQTRLTKMNPS